MFRWLFGNSKQNEGDKSASNSHNDYHNLNYGRNYHSLDNFHEEQTIMIRWMIFDYGQRTDYIISAEERQDED